MAKTKRGVEYSANMRRALYEGMLEAAKKKGMGLTEYCAYLWDDDWKAAMNAFAKFQVKEHTGNVQHNHNHEHHHTTDTAAFLDNVLGIERPEEETKH